MASSTATKADLEVIVQQQNRDYEDLKAKFELLQASLNSSEMNSATAVDRPTDEVSASDLALARAPPGRLPVTTTLRSPPIDRFSGDREKTANFLLAMDRRLASTGQEHTPNGLEFATGHFTGYAATWWRYFAPAHPEVTSWAGLRPFVSDHFKLVAETELYEERLRECKQTGDLSSYVEEFLDIAARLSSLPSDFLMRSFARGSNAYLREKFATREKFSSLLEMINYTLALIPVVDARLLEPDAPARPVVAAMPARARGRGSSGGAPGKTRFEGNCHGCGQWGHRARDCPKGKSHTGSKPGPAARGRTNFGRYNTGTGKVNAVVAEPVVDVEDLSDDELREGNGRA